jgi:hypothetical protein
VHQTSFPIFYLTNPQPFPQIYLVSEYTEDTHLSCKHFVVIGHGQRRLFLSFKYFFLSFFLYILHICLANTLVCEDLDIYLLFFVVSFFPFIISFFRCFVLLISRSIVLSFFHSFILSGGFSGFFLFMQNFRILGQLILSKK